MKQLAKRGDARSAGGGGSSANSRRRFILETLRRNGNVSFETLEEQFAVNRASLHLDVDVLQQLGEPVDLVLKDGRSYIVQISPHTPSTKEFREKLATEEKRRLALVAAGLVLGTDSHPDMHEPNFTGPTVIPEIIKQLDGFLAWDHRYYPLLYQKINQVKNTLFRFWGWDPNDNRLNNTGKRHRLVALDAGTTTEPIGQEIGAIRLPDARTGVSNIRVLTNSPTIAAQLMSTKSSADVIVIGGRIRKDTQAIAGTLADRILRESLDLMPDIAFVGTTNVNLNDMTVGSDSDLESETKSLILEKATLLKAIVADSSKVDRPVSSSFPFARLEASSLDMLITDNRVKKEHVERLASHGVICLRAPDYGQCELPVEPPDIPCGLNAMSSDPNSALRLASVAALRQLGHSAYRQGVLPLLNRLSKDCDQQVAKAATLAVKEIKESA